MSATALGPRATNQKYTVGVYHSLAENLTLPRSSPTQKRRPTNGVENDSSNFNVGAYLSF